MSLERILTETLPLSFRRDVVSRDADRFQEFVRKVAESPEVSIGELMMFMHGFGLRFGVAEGRTERGTYMILQTRLSSLQNEVMRRPAQGEQLPDK